MRVCLFYPAITADSDIQWSRRGQTQLSHRRAKVSIIISNEKKPNTAKAVLLKLQGV